MCEILDWAASGAMAITGRPDGPPELGPGSPATLVRSELTRIAQIHPRASLPGVSLLGERAAAAGLTRNAPWSCGGAFRILPTGDGWLGVSLARPADLDLLPALVCGPVAEPWRDLAQWARESSTRDALDRTQLLGLAACAVPEPSGPSRDPVLVTPGGLRRNRRHRPLIIDLTSLWAGPLTAHLLWLCGAEVVKVESALRLDGARRGPARFYDVLHQGHASVTLNFADPRDRRSLRSLLLSADLVLESSRPRALAQLGIDAHEVVRGGTSWLSITGYGRASNRVAFGDDAAAGAGLVTSGMAPCGDALADPLSGVVAARYAAEALTADHAVLMDVSMHHVAALAAIGAGEPEPHRLENTAAGWWVECAHGREAVAPPMIRRSRQRAAAPGTGNDIWVPDPALPM